MVSDESKNPSDSVSPPEQKSNNILEPVSTPKPNKRKRARNNTSSATRPGSANPTKAKKTRATRSSKVETLSNQDVNDVEMEEKEPSIDQVVGKQEKVISSITTGTLSEQTLQSIPPKTNDSASSESMKDEEMEGEDKAELKRNVTLERESNEETVQASTLAPAISPRIPIEPSAPVTTSIETDVNSQTPEPSVLPPLSLQLPSQQIKETTSVPNPPMIPTAPEVAKKTQTYVNKMRLQSIATPAKKKPSETTQMESQTDQQSTSSKAESATKTDEGSILQEKMPNGNGHGPVIEDDENLAFDSPVYTKTYFWIFSFFMLQVAVSSLTGLPFVWEKVPTASKSYSKAVFTLYEYLYPDIDDNASSKISAINDSDNSATCAFDVCETPDDIILTEKQKAFDHQIDARLKKIAKRNLQVDQEKLNIVAMKEIVESPNSLSILSSSDISQSNIDLENDVLEEHIQEELDLMKAWEEKLDEAEQALNDVERDGFQAEREINKKMEDLADVSPIPIATMVFDESTVEVSGEGCSHETGKNPSISLEEEAKKEYLTRVEFEEKKEYVVELAQSTTSEMISDKELSSSIRKWVESEVSFFEMEYDLNEIEEMSAEEPLKQPEIGISAEVVQTLISNVLEIEAADGTGKRDYASLEAGGSVIRKGPRKTSPSLVDNLPIGNRILAALKLRFYGHQAEAALRETYPKYALGQCWSFQEEKTTEESEEIVGTFGTLSVNLAHEIDVESIMIEHPPREITQSIGTAIKAFRVFGYTDEDAEGFAWPLGSFEYDINASRPNQKFQVETRFMGSKIPLLRSISLAVDSNWGEDYACLYRFRVHGI